MNQKKFTRRISCDVYAMEMCCMKKVHFWTNFRAMFYLIALKARLYG